MTGNLVKKYPEHEAAVDTGYCSIKHAMIAEPDIYDPERKKIRSSLGLGATTT